MTTLFLPGKAAPPSVDEEVTQYLHRPTEMPVSTTAPTASFSSAEPDVRSNFRPGLLASSMVSVFLFAAANLVLEASAFLYVNVPADITKWGELSRPPAFSGHPNDLDSTLDGPIASPQLSKINSKSNTLNVTALVFQPDLTFAYINGFSNAIP